MILGTPSGDVTIDGLRGVAQSRSRGSFASAESFAAAITGRSVSRSDAMGLPAFWSGVMLKAKTAGTLPLEVRTVAGDELVSGAGVAKRLRWQANAERPASQVFTSLFSMYVASHNAFALKLPASDEIFAPELFPLPPECVHVYRGPGRELRYDVYAPDGSEFAMGVHGMHVIHFCGPSIDGGLVGTSPVKMLANALGVALAAQEYQGAMYRNGGVPLGILSVSDVLTVEQARTIRDQWNATYGGMENAGRIAVLDRGAEFKNTGLSNEDAQFIQQMQLSATDCARMLNLPAALINAEGASLTYANASHNDMHLLKFSLRPDLKIFEDTLNMDPDFFGVHSPWKPVFNTDAITRMDQTARYANYSQAIGAGWMLPDEARAAEGLSGKMPAPVGGGTDAARDLERVVRALVDEREARGEPVPAQFVAHIHNEIPEQGVPEVRVDVAAPEVRVEPVFESQPAPVVNVHVPEQSAPVVNVEPPVVNVAAPDVRVDVAAPNVQVDNPITVQPASSGGGKSVTFQRNKQGNIVGAEIAGGE